MEILNRILGFLASVPKKILLGIAGGVILLILFLSLQSMVSGCIHGVKEEYFPDPAPAPVVDYKLDRDWSTCIFRRLESVQRSNEKTGKEMIQDCDMAFTKPKAGRK